MLRWASRTLAISTTIAALVVGLGLAVLQLHGGRVLSVQTGSMTPAIRKGDLVSITRVPAGQLVVGDVVTYVSPFNPKKTITHRIVALPSPRTHGQLITKGDANPTADPAIAPSSVLGRVRWYVPYAGRALDFVRRPAGLLVLIYVPALAVVVDEIRRLSRYYRSQQPYLAPGFRPRHTFKLQRGRSRLVLAGQLAVVLVGGSLCVARPVAARLSSHVALAGITIKTAPLQRGCSGTSNTSVVVTNSTNQTASTGTVSGQGGATSGNASASNSTSIGITINNC